MAIAVLHDATKCLGCGQCVAACAAKNNPNSTDIISVKSSPVPLTPTTWTRVRYKDVVYNGKSLRVATAAGRASPGPPGTRAPDPRRRSPRWRAKEPSRAWGAGACPPGGPSR